MKYQNFILLFITIGILSLFNSCKKDSNNLIIGTWTFEKNIVDLYTDNPEMDSFLKHEIAQILSMEEGTQITFNENGSYTTSHPDNENITTEGKYSFEGDKFFMDDEHYSYTFEKKKFLITRYFGDTINLDDLPDITIHNLTITFILKK